MIRMLLLVTAVGLLPGCGAIQEAAWTAACSSPLHLDRRAGMSLEGCVQKNVALQNAANRTFAQDVVREFGVNYYFCGPSLCQSPRQFRRW